MRHIILSFLFLFSISIAKAQSEELATEQNLVSEQIDQVEGAKSAFDQRWSFDEEVPYRVELTITETDKKKGKSQTTKYRFNLADLDENLIRQETKKDLKYITAGVSGKQNLIEVFKEGKQENYVNKVSVLVSDSQAAAELKNSIRNLIPLAKELDKQRLNINTYPEMVSWLEKNMDDFSQGEVNYQVNFNSLEEDELIYEYEIKGGTKKGNTTKYTFNLADLDPYSIKLNVKGKTIAVNAGTVRKQRFVTIYENGELKNYDDAVSFQMGEVEIARDLAEVLRMIVPEAGKQRSENLTPTEDLGASLETFQRELINFDQGDKKYKHELEPNCFTTYRLEETTSKGQTEEAYELHLGDLASNNVAIKVAAKDIFVIGEVKAGDKFVKNFRDGEQRNYTDEVAFRAAGVENAKTLAFLLKQVAETCDEQQQRVLAATQKTDLGDWITGQVDHYKDAAQPEYEQHLTINEGECSLVFSTITPKGKGVTKMKYEVFLKELDQKALAPYVSGKTMSVKLKTTYNEDHIKSYKDEEVEKFTDNFNIRVPGIVEARSLISGLKKLLTICEE